MTQYFKRIPTTAYQFWNKKDGQYCWTCLHQLRVDFEAEEGDRLEWKGILNFKDRGLLVPPAYPPQVPISWGIKASLRWANGWDGFITPPTSSVDLPYFQSAPILPCSKVAGNIAGLIDHYGTAVLIGDHEIPDDGCYRLEWWATAASSANGPDGLIDLNFNPGATEAQIMADPYSYLTVKVSS